MILGRDGSTAAAFDDPESHFLDQIGGSAILPQAVI
jgi:hypothetical protein